MATNLAVADNIFAVCNNVNVDVYDSVNHSVFEIPSTPSVSEGDSIVDIIISPDSKQLALLTSITKRLLIYNLPIIDAPRTFFLPRTASKGRFTKDNKQIIIADKTGEVLIYNIHDENSKGVKLLGHLSLLLDVLITGDNKYIITCDRDEKIRVSSYPNTYNIQSYCLGHKEFVNHLELLPHNSKYLMSSSGDGTIKIWDYLSGKLYHTIDTSLDVNDNLLQEQFSKSMDQDGVEVNTLPVVHLAVAVLENHSTVAITVYNFNKILIYNINELSHKCEDKISLENFPTGIQFHKSLLYVYTATEQSVDVYSSCNSDNTFKCVEKIKVFDGKSIKNISTSKEESIKILFKRKFDNVHEYLERKKMRIEQNAQ